MKEAIVAGGRALFCHPPATMVLDVTGNCVMHQVIRIVAADAHPVFLEGLARALQAQDDLTICATTTRIDDVVPLVLRHEPDILLIDALMKGSIGAAQSVTRARPMTKIIMLAGSLDAIPHKAVEISGGRAWVLKTMSGAYLAATIRITQNSGFTIGPGLSGRIVLMGDRLIDRTMTESMPIRFSGRETDVMRYVCRGMSNREMADTLGIRETTVKNYVVKIKRKLNATSRDDIVRLCGRYLADASCALLSATGTCRLLGQFLNVL